MNLQTAISKVQGHHDLSRDQMRAVMHQITSGAATPAQIGGLLIGLRMKGETVDEIAAAASVLRELATPIRVSQEHLVDTCGTGGDSAGTFNVSTAAALVVAAAGGRVAKHGNRSISGKSGSADVLEAAGVNLNLTPAAVARCIDELGIGFLFAVHHHGAMRHASGPRRELGVRTLFNVLGPLTNPASAPNQVVGVFSRDLVVPLASALRSLGGRHVLVVHSEDGLDEISIAAPTYYAELVQGRVETGSMEPESFGITRRSLISIKVDSVAESLAMMRHALAGGAGPARDIVALNAGAALYVAGVTTTMAQGCQLACRTLDEGLALARLDALAGATQRMIA